MPYEGLPITFGGKLWVFDQNLGGNHSMFYCYLIRFGEERVIMLKSSLLHSITLSCFQNHNQLC